MTLSWSEFSAQRKGFTTQYVACPGATRTIMVCSHIWWTDQIALAVRNLGYNVLLHSPLYLLYTDASAFARFDELWNQILAEMRQAKVNLIIGGNSSAMLAHPKTGELLHEAAGSAPGNGAGDGGRGQAIPLVNWWWDEVRSKPPMATWPGGGGFAPSDFVRFLRNEHTLNAIWDIDVKEELEAQLGLTNLLHLPLATLPEHWPHGYVPLKDRPLAASFLGNCHFTAEWVETSDDPQIAWARDVALAKIASPDTPMQACADRVTAGSSYGGKVPAARDPLDPADLWLTFMRPWEIVNAAYMHYTRNKLVQAAAAHLGGKLALIGKGWEKLGLRANMEHAGDKSGVIYGQSQLCLNLFGGCVHGGLPLRPYDIGASGGLILTHYQRELPGLFDVCDGRGRGECLAFRSGEEMVKWIERVRTTPAEFDHVAQAGRKRVLSEHTWGHRVKKLLDAVGMV